MSPLGARKHFKAIYIANVTAPFIEQPIVLVISWYDQISYDCKHFTIFEDSMQDQNFYSYNVEEKDLVLSSVDSKMLTINRAIFVGL